MPIFIKAKLPAGAVWPFSLHRKEKRIVKKSNLINVIFILIIFIATSAIGHAQCTTVFNDVDQMANHYDDVLVYQAVATTVPSVLIIELWQAFGGPLMPGIYSIEDDTLNSNYSTCHTCVLIVDSTGTSERIFYATFGEIDIDSIGPVGTLFAGTLSNANLIEVTIDPVTFESIPVPNGETRCIDSFSFNALIEGDVFLDSDGDGLTDEEEANLGTDPLNPDTDGDMLWDGDEVLFFGTDPLNSDTDDGGVSDGQEVFNDGTDPFDPTDDLILIDEDNDGFPLGPDCDDSDPSINPAAEEIWYDGIDQNCDGHNDFDQDMDWSPVDQDCDDTNALVNPGIPEICDGLDNNCDGIIDDQGPCIAVRLTWHTPGDPDETDNFGADLDLHFLHPDGEWWELPWDCFWQNRYPAWGAKLDIDDTNGLGPEVISLSNPEADALYKIGVDYFNAKGFGLSIPTVKIFINGQMLFEETGQPLSEKDFWEVAEIDWDSGVVINLSDLDGDGIANDIDSCPSSNLSETIIVDGCDTGVTNYMVSDGCTISDQITECAVDARNHGGFVSCIAHLTNELKIENIISGIEKGAIQRCAAQTPIP